jgi:hypothetical protein
MTRLRGNAGYLKFLQVRLGIINQSESSGLAAAKLGAESECLHGLLGDFVHLREASTDIVFGEIGFCGVKDVDDELLAAEETVCLEFAGA